MRKIGTNDITDIECSVESKEGVGSGSNASNIPFCPACQALDYNHVY